MRMIVKVAAATALAAGTVAATDVTASAAGPNENAGPAQVGVVSVQIAPGAQYTGDAAANWAQIVTPIGTITTAGNQFTVRDDHGQTVWGDPTISAPVAPATDTWLAATGEVELPVNAVDRHQSTNTVSAGTTELTATPNGPADPIDSPSDPMMDFEAALAVAATNFGAASSVGAMVGGVAGALIGCPLGVATGGTLMAPTIVGTPLGMVGGCLIGAATVGGVGAIVGGAALGIPVAIASGVQMYNTLHAQGHV